MTSPLFSLALGLYLLAAGGLIVFIIGQQKWVFRSSFGILVAGFVCHTLFLGYGYYELGTAPVLDLRSALSFFAWSIVGVYLIVQARFKLMVLGSFVAPLAGFLRHEVEGKIRGLLQKVLDGFTEPEGLASQIEAMDPDRQAAAMEALRGECLERLVLEGDNTPLLKILSQVAGVNTGPVETLLLRYQDDLQTRRADRAAALKEQIRVRGISGTAVIPNLNADSEWIRSSDEARDRFHRELAGL